jgi:ABC-type dipeptide/oligopeptide/nickel transport system ATPase component
MASNSSHLHPDLLLSAHLTVRYGDKPPVLRGVAIDIQRGEVLGLVGQSGSGKSTLGLSLLGLLDRKRTRVEGSIKFHDSRFPASASQTSDLLQLSERDWRGLRGRSIALVLQSPLSSLNPALRIRTQLKEAWRAHAGDRSEDCSVAIRSALQSVSLPADENFQRKYPSQMSVGQAQRVLIAMAILHRPALLIADEATSALDVITQAEILALFRELNRSFGMSILYISHDLASVAGICDRIAILHQGEIVESGTTAQIFSNPRHEYTQRLMAAIPRIPTQDSVSRSQVVAASAGL